MKILAGCDFTEFLLGDLFNEFIGVDIDVFKIDGRFVVFFKNVKKIELFHECVGHQFVEKHLQFLFSFLQLFFIFFVLE